jgi:hypothetical protein
MERKRGGVGPRDETGSMGNNRDDQGLAARKLQKVVNETSGGRSGRIEAVVDRESARIERSFSLS